MGWLLVALTTLAQDSGSVASIYVVAHNHM